MLSKHNNKLLRFDIFGSVVKKNTKNYLVVMKLGCGSVYVSACCLGCRCSRGNDSGWDVTFSLFKSLLLG